MRVFTYFANVLLDLHLQYHYLTYINFKKEDIFEKERYEKERNIVPNQITYVTRIKNNEKKIFPAFEIYNSPENGKFSIEYRSYKGRIGKKAVWAVQEQSKNQKYRYYLKNESGEFKVGKHGLFDFYVNTGNRYRKLYGGDATHFNLFRDLLTNTTYTACKRVWRGVENISDIAKSQNEFEALLTLSLLMFEQEVNYGEEKIFQQSINFKISKGFRPRDMIMGFVNMIFHDENLFNEYPYWSRKYGYKNSPHFGKAAKGEGYENLEWKYKMYFEKYRFHYPQVKALLEDPLVKDRFVYYTLTAYQNPDILSLKLNI